MNQMPDSIAQHLSFLNQPAKPKPKHRLTRLTESCDIDMVATPRTGSETAVWRCACGETGTVTIEGLPLRGKVRGEARSAWQSHADGAK